ncbi:DUF342 domain-containing protein [Campylobacter sp. LR185c]|uniref:flagellar assembly protein A n=1 Tax=Campylobacter sp. LR185c TaxID=2014525 RepID=UPI0012381DBE|nr:flagellar assembly protein A [Campylobacter sp. LR185c]KAA6227111.1 DUF342 domain-containing protein [Campylobacter sp. LR185c]KAA8603828.1 hypothetical protein CGP82_05385 [Campylobacter sp. LR185c]
MNEKIRTSFPKESFEEFIRKNELKASEYSYKISDFFTHYSENNDGNYILLDKEELVMFEHDNFFVNTNFKIYQEYEIEIYKKENEPVIDLKFVNMGNVTIGAVLKKSERPIKQDITQFLKDRIYRAMANAGFLLDFRIFDFHNNIKLLGAKFLKDGIIDRDYSLPIARGVASVDDTDEKLILHYEQILEEKKGKDFSYAKKEFSSIIEKNELVLEYKKIIEGKDGKNLKCQFLSHISYSPQLIFSVNDEHFIKEENSSSIKYFAKINGFVKNESFYFDIVNSLDMKNLNLKNTGSVLAGDNKKVSLNIQTLKEEDGIKDGIVVETEKINLQGSVAQSTIRSKNVNINGQTHSKSKIYAKKAQIFNHKGYLEADTAFVNVAERCFIKAKIAVVKTCINSNIEAEKIYIKSLHSQNTIKFLKTCIIEHCKGESNTFSFDMNVSQSFKNSLEESFRAIETFKKTNVALKKELEFIKKSLAASKESMSNILKSYKQLRENNQPVPQSFERQIVNFQGLIKREKELIEILGSGEENVDKLGEHLTKMQKIVTQAKVINIDNTWGDGYNKIIFNIPFPKTTLAHTLRGEEDCTKITLKEQNDSYVLNFGHAMDENELKPFNKQKYLDFIYE